MDLITEGMKSVPEITALQTQDYVGVANQFAAALGLIQGMAGREIHAPHFIDYGSLQCLGQLDETRQANGGAGRTIGNDERTLGSNQEASGLGNRARISLRRRRQGQLRN